MAGALWDSKLKLAFISKSPYVCGYLAKKTAVPSLRDAHTIIPIILLFIQKDARASVENFTLIAAMVSEKI